MTEPQSHFSNRLKRFIPLLPIFGFAALTLLYMMPFVRTPTGRETLDGSDLVNQQYPLYSLIFDSVRDGRGLPLWNPYQYAGQSIVNNPQSTLYYPPAWIMIPFGVPRGSGWLAAFHLFFGACGFYVFTRQIGANRFGGFIGGAVYSFSALMGAHLGAGHLNYILCQAWLPWIAAAYLWALPRGWMAALPGAAALGMCILTGYPPLLYFGLIWLGALWLYTVTDSSKNWRSALIRATRPLLIIGIVGGLLGAALLIPVGLFTLRSARGASTVAFGNSFALPGSEVMTLAFPNLFGFPKLEGNGYWGAPFYEEHTAAIGILPLIALCLVRRGRIRWLLGAFVVIGLFTSLGSDAGLFNWLYYLLPGYSLFRVPPRALYFVVVGGAGLVALLLTHLQIAPLLPRQTMLRPALRIVLPGLIVIGLAGGVALSAVYFTIQSKVSEAPWRAFYSGSIFMLGALFSGTLWIILRFWARHSADKNNLLLSSITAFVILINLWSGSAQLVTVSAVDVPSQWSALATVAPGAADYRVMTLPPYLPWQATSYYTKHLNANGYDPLVSDDIQRLIDLGQNNPDSAAFRLLGVRYVVSNSVLTGRTSIAKVGDWSVYQQENPIARVFIAEKTVIASRAAIYEQIKAANTDLQKTALVEADGVCDAIAGSGTATITHYEPNEVQITATGRGLLVLTDAYDPDWTATVDSVSVPLVRVDAALRGVCLAEDKPAHTVIFRYTPNGFYGAVAISVIAWLALAAFGIFHLVMQRGVNSPA